MKPPPCVVNRWTGGGSLTSRPMSFFAIFWLAKTLVNKQFNYNTNSKNLRISYLSGLVCRKKRIGKFTMKQSNEHLVVDLTKNLNAATK